MPRKSKPTLTAAQTLMAVGESFSARTGKPLIPVRHFELTAHDREMAIRRADDSCEKCGWVAWTHARQAELVVRPHPTNPDALQVVCPGCATTKLSKAG